MEYKPLYDRVLVKPIPDEELIGGIIIPKTANSPKRGTAVAVGPGNPGSPMAVKEGQIVLYKKDEGYEVVINDIPYLIFYERTLLMVKDEGTPAA